MSCQYQKCQKISWQFWKLSEYLKHDFTVIGLSETWLSDNDGDLYGLCGYKVIGHNGVEGWQFVFKIMFISTEQNNGNRENVCLLMSNIRWDEISRATDTQQAFDTFHKHLIEMYNKHFPKIRIKRKYKNKKPGCLKVWQIPSNKRINFI